jgi:hypothetical protein
VIRVIPMQTIPMQAIPMRAIPRATVYYWTQEIHN